MRSLRPWHLIGALLLLACLVTAGLVWVTLHAPDGDGRGGIAARSAAVTPLYLNGDYGPQFAGEMVAETRGFFAASGVRIRLQPLPDDGEFFAALVRDRAIGVTTGHKFLLARWRGAPLIAFGAPFLDTAAAVFARDGSGIRTPRDLVGRRLGYRPGAEELVVYDAMMAQLGVPRSQVRLVAVDDVFAALGRGEVDAGVAQIAQMPAPSDSDGRFNVIRPQDYGIHIPGLVYVAGSDLVRDNPSIVRQALRAMILGWQAVYADTAQATATVAAFAPARLVPAQVAFTLAQQRDLVRPTGMRIADFDESRWTTLRDILLYARLAEQAGPLSPAVTYEFLRDVYRRPLNTEGEDAGAASK